MSAHVVLACQRSDCNALEDLELTAEDVRQLTPLAIQTRAVEEQVIEDGWGYDLADNGLDEVLHCPEHRVIL